MRPQPMPLFITAWFENGLMRHVFQKNPTVEPIRVEGLQPFAPVKGMKVESLGRAVR